MPQKNRQGQSRVATEPASRSVCSFLDLAGIVPPPCAYSRNHLLLLLFFRSTRLYAEPKRPTFAAWVSQTTAGATALEERRG
jgi:hypothetical protein